MSEAHGIDDNPSESRDRGETMLMTVVLITFLLLGSWTLISASQQWGARRDVQAVSSAAARAGAQVSEVEVRGGSVAIDPSRAEGRAAAVLAASGYTGSVSVDGLTVTVVATGSVDYAFPAPGFPGQLSATSTAIAVRGVDGSEGG
jgi:Flp pilus assembly protein TadG